MIPAVIVSADGELAAQFEHAVSQAGGVCVVRTLRQFPVKHALDRLIRAHAPQLFFLDIGVPDEALRVAADIEASAPGMQLVAFDRTCDQSKLMALMRAGIREFLAAPFDPVELAGSIARVAAALERKPPAIDCTDQVVAFLPCKPGVGASTLALNTCVALAKLPDTRVLLMDFDLNCGLIGFLLQLESTPSVVDAAEHAAHLDEDLWPKLVRRVGNLDVLPAGRMKPGFRIEVAQIRYLLEFARRNYQVVCADLSGLMEKYSLELMQEAKRIALVCTPELPALYLAREKLEFLRSAEMEDRVMLLLNRSQKRQTISTPEIENMLGVSVALDFPNDYRGVHEALTEAKPVRAASELGRRFHELAMRLLAKQPQPRPGRRFVDYFSITPAQYTFETQTRKG